MRKKMMAVMTALFCAVSIFCTSIETKADSIGENELESYIMEEMSSANILGMGISIVSSEKELYCAAYGAAQQPESDYVLGSLSKSFTAAAIMRMKEDGDLSLEDTVSDYLTGYIAVSDVTIQELLNQTSGIAASERMSDLQGKGKRGHFEYANANYNLLGEIIESVSGLSYEEYVSDNILDPLEMTSTYSLRTGADLSEELLSGYQNYFGFPFASRYQYDKDDDWIQVPSGYMISDAKDMGRYLQMYLNHGGDVLSAESVDTMLYKGVDTSSDTSVSDDLFGGTAKYGMGWVEKEVDGQSLLYHAGKTENFTTMMVLLPEQDLGIVMLFNSMDFLVGQKLIETLEEGIVSLEMGQTPDKIDSKTYMLQHGLIDVLLLFFIILAWMPIFLMGVWSKRRREKMICMPGLIIDAFIHIVLPTALLLILPNVVPVFMVKRFVPDVYYVVCGVIASLYFGAVVKLIAGVVIALRGKKKQKGTEIETVKEPEKKEKISSEEKAEEKELSEADGTEEKEQSVDGNEVERPDKETDAVEKEKQAGDEEDKK